MNLLLCVAFFTVCIAVLTEEDDLMLQCTLLLQRIATLHPDFMRYIKQTESGSFRLHDKQLLRKRDPISHLQYLFEQGGLLCEMTKTYLVIKTTSVERLRVLKANECTMPSSAADPESEDSVGQELCHQNYEMFLRHWGQMHPNEDVSITEEPDIVRFFDLIGVAEKVTSELAILLPLYPILGFRPDDANSDSSFETSYLFANPKKPVLDPAFQELLSTEKAYITKLVKMYEYYILASTSPVYHLKAQLIFPGLVQLRNFHLGFYTQLQKYTEDLSSTASLFCSFEEMRLIYSDWIYSVHTVSSAELHFYPSHDLHAILPDDKSSKGLYAHRLQPMQRILRYPLLLKEMMKFRNEGDKLYLEIAHRFMSDFNDDVNQFVYRQELLKSKSDLLNERDTEMTIIIQQSLSGQALLRVCRCSLRYMIDENGTQVIVTQPVQFYIFENTLLFRDKEEIKSKRRSEHEAKGLGRKLNERLLLNIKRSVSTNTKTRTVTDKSLLPRDVNRVHLIQVKNIRQVYHLSTTGLRIVVAYLKNVRIWRDVFFDSEEEAIAIRTYELIRKLVQPVHAQISSPSLRGVQFHFRNRKYYTFIPLRDSYLSYDDLHAAIYRKLNRRNEVYELYHLSNEGLSERKVTGDDDLAQIQKILPVAQTLHFDVRVRSIDTSLQSDDVALLGNGSPS